MLKRLIPPGALCIAATLAAAPAMAQDFPNKHVKLVVPVNPGGATDALARVTAEFLGKRLGQTVVVENKPGASSTIGIDYVAKAPADGYTLLLVGTEFGAVPATRKTPYKFDELTYLIRGFTVSPLMYASPQLPVASLAELVPYMKAHPDKVRYGSTGIGAIVHLGMSMFQNAAGVKALHVPYPGIAPVYNDLLAGHIDLSEGAPPFPAGIKVLGSVGSKRNSAFPNLPTLEEVGVKGATWDQWFGFFAQPNLPKPLADKLTAELSAVFKDPEAIAKFKQVTSFEPDTAPLVGDAFKRSVIEENKKWKALVDREKIVVE